MNEYFNKENNTNNNGAYCYYHPREFLVGVCPLCLNDKLLVVAAKQGLKNRPKSSKFLPNRSLTHNNNNNNNTDNKYYKSKPSITGLPKIFALGSFLNRSDRRNRRFHKSSDRFNVVDFGDDLDSTSTSLEDESSFISIKFGDNGVAVASWDKKSNSTSSSTVSKVSLDNCTMSWSGQTSVKPKNTSCNCPVNNNTSSSSKCKCKSMVEHAKPRTPLRWRNRIGQLFQVIRWKRSTSAGGNNTSKCEGVKVVRNNNKGWIRSFNIRTRK